MQYFVTGATGFIGKRLVKKLLERKGSVVYFLLRKESAGKVAELHDRFHELDVGLVLVDGPVSPVQQRNLEKAWKAKVLDRTGLILEIFGDRARTREGVLQVELAHLSYQKSRLVRSWTHLERQRGGAGQSTLGGGAQPGREIASGLGRRLAATDVDRRLVLRGRGVRQLPHRPPLRIHLDQHHRRAPAGELVGVGLFP